MSRHKKEPLLSVIVPVYNTEKYLEECLDSILGQTFKNFEIIIVDDGSTDGSGKICDGYAQKDKRVHVIHKTNGGLVSARKEGITAARGKYISYVDSDDWIDKNRYREMYEKGMKLNVDMISANIINEYSYGGNMVIKDACGEGYFTGEELDNVVNNIVDLEKFYMPKQHLSLCKYIFKKAILFEAQMSVDNSITIGEDDVTTLQCLAKTESLVCIYGASYHYRKHAESMMHVNNSSQKSHLKLIYETISKTCSGYKNFDRLMRQLNVMIFMELLTSDYFALMEDEDRLFPYGIEKGKRIVIYGAGSLGCEIVRYINKCSQWILAGWCDGNSEAYSDYAEKYGVDVYAPENIKGFEYDYILIAITNCMVVDRVKEFLLSLGIEMKRIRYIDNMNNLSDEKLIKVLYKNENKEKCKK